MGNKMKILILLVSSLYPMWVGIARGQECPVSAASTKDQLIGFIEQQRNQKDTDFRCVTAAFVFLGHQPNALKILAGYLDYRRPPTEDEKRGIRSDHVVRATDWYPAIEPLVEMGKTATPELFRAIRENENDTVRANAAYALNRIYPSCTNELLDLVAVEERKSINGIELGRLRAAEYYIRDERKWATCLS